MSMSDDDYMWLWYSNRFRSLREWSASSTFIFRLQNDAIFQAHIEQIERIFHNLNLAQLKSSSWSHRICHLSRGISKKKVFICWAWNCFPQSFNKNLNQPFFKSFSRPKQKFPFNSSFLLHFPVKTWKTQPTYVCMKVYFLLSRLHAWLFWTLSVCISCFLEVPRIIWLKMLQSAII